MGGSSHGSAAKGGNCHRTGDFTGVGPVTWNSFAPAANLVILSMPVPLRRPFERKHCTKEGLLVFERFTPGAVIHAMPRAGDPIALIFCGLSMWHEGC